MNERKYCLMKKLIALVLALVFVFALAACSTSVTAPTTEPTTAPTTAPATAPASETKIGISMPTKSLERWNRDGALIKGLFEDAGYSTTLTYSDNDSDQQNNDIQNMIADGVDILIIAAIDGSTLSQTLADASAQGIPVIAYDRLIMDTDSVAYYVSFDNYTVGVLQGQFVIDKLGLDLKDTSKTYNIEFTAGDPADNNAGYFFNGAYDTLKPYLDAGILKCVSGQTVFEQVATAEWKTDNALNRFQNILASYYADGTQLDVALCSNDSTALGVTQAIESDYSGSNAVIVTGQDGDVANLKNLIDGKQTMTVYKAVSNEAYVTFDLACAILNGKTPDAGLIESSGWNFECTYDTESYNNNVKNVPSYLLVPDTVTIDNYTEKLVDSGYYTVGSDGYLQPVN
jgi:putative multiple sugar transport system substrate-binding protein